MHLTLSHSLSAFGRRRRKPHSRQRKRDLGPAHGARVLLELHHPFPQAWVAAPVHARVDATPSDRVVRKVVGLQIDGANCLPPRHQVAALDQHGHDAKQGAANHVHLAVGLCRDVTIPATQCGVRCENSIVHPVRKVLHVPCPTSGPVDRRRVGGNVCHCSMR
eukprot:scaffold53422_cov62-Phaeocystis_antarctica.AAC.2